MEKYESEGSKSKVNEENQKESGVVKKVEKRVEAIAQVELNRKWIPRHTLVALEVLG